MVFDLRAPCWFVKLFQKGGWVLLLVSYFLPFLSLIAGVGLPTLRHDIHGIGVVSFFFSPRLVFGGYYGVLEDHIFTLSALCGASLSDKQGRYST